MAGCSFSPTARMSWPVKPSICWRSKRDPRPRTPLRDLGRSPARTGHGATARVAMGGPELDRQMARHEAVAQTSLTMCLAVKLSPAQIERMNQAHAALARVVEFGPELRRALPRAMHPVLDDLSESANCVYGYLSGHGFGDEAAPALPEVLPPDMPPGPAARRPGRRSATAARGVIVPFPTGGSAGRSPAPDES